MMHSAVDPARNATRDIQRYLAFLEIVGYYEERPHLVAESGRQTADSMGAFTCADARAQDVVGAQLAAFRALRTDDPQFLVRMRALCDETRERLVGWAATKNGDACI